MHKTLSNPVIRVVPELPQDLVARLTVEMTLSALEGECIDELFREKLADIKPRLVAICECGCEVDVFPVRTEFGVEYRIDREHDCEAEPAADLLPAWLNDLGTEDWQLVQAVVEVL